MSLAAYFWIANGQSNMCFHPKDLNTAIKWDHYRVPVMEEITCELAGSTYFTKLDGISSFLCIVFHYESNMLAIFNTQYGRYHFVCLPYGLDCAQDIF